MLIFNKPNKDTRVLGTIPFSLDALRGGVLLWFICYFALFINYSEFVILGKNSVS